MLGVVSERVVVSEAWSADSSMAPFCGAVSLAGCVAGENLR